jgi:hypothetical protein
MYFNKHAWVSRLRFPLTPFFVFALMLWLLNPYACCPEDAASAMPMTDYSAEEQQLAAVANGLVFQGESPSQSTIDSLPKGTPGSLPEPTPNLPSPLLTLPVWIGLVSAIFTPDEVLLSEIILPSVPPPRS